MCPCRSLHIPFRWHFPSVITDCPEGTPWVTDSGTGFQQGHDGCQNTSQRVTKSSLPTWELPLPLGLEPGGAAMCRKPGW